MKKLTIKIFLSVAVFFGSAGLGLGQTMPDLSGLNYETKSSIQSACYDAKIQGPAPYARCINSHLATVE